MTEPARRTLLPVAFYLHLSLRLVYALGLFLALVFGPLMIAILLAHGHGDATNRPLPLGGTVLLVSLSFGWIAACWCVMILGYRMSGRRGEWPPGIVPAQ